MRNIGHYIAGIRRKGNSKRTAPIFNPSTGEEIGFTSLATKAEVDAAVVSAKRAFNEWSEVPAMQRAQILFNYRALLHKNFNEIASILSQENGKTFEDAKGELMRGIEIVEYACGIPQLLKGEFSNQVARGVDAWSIKVPVGVCVGITPFNFPAMVPMWMFPLAIAAGNTFLLKPSEQAPSCPMLLASLLSEAGLPAGVLNVINGDEVAVNRLITHPDVAAISFVGSTLIAEKIYQTGTAHKKRVQALGSAKNHMVIMPDADLGMAADALIGATYGSAGQRCMAVSVAVVIGDETSDLMAKTLSEKVRALHVGPGSDPATQIGPVISQQAKNRINGLIDSGVQQGAELVVDGREPEVPGYEDGFFVGATLFDRVSAEMDIYKQEIFGPVLSVVRVANYEEACDLIENNEYGNGAVIFTRDGGVARKFCHSISIGMVGVNVPIPVPVAFHSFGGWKRSLFGEHHIHGPEGINFYTRQKQFSSRWPDNLEPEFYVRSGAII